MKTIFLYLLHIFSISRSLFTIPTKQYKSMEQRLDARKRLGHYKRGRKRNSWKGGQVPRLDNILASFTSYDLVKQSHFIFPFLCDGSIFSPLPPSTQHSCSRAGHSKVHRNHTLNLNTNIFKAAT